MSLYGISKTLTQIHFEGVSKAYGKKMILNDFNLKINRGEILTQ